MTTLITTDPCQGVCDLINGAPVCSGCFITPYEKKEWNEATDSRKIEIYSRSIARINIKIEMIKSELKKFYSEELNAKKEWLLKTKESRVEKQKLIRESLDAKKKRVKELKEEFEEDGPTQEFLKKLFYLNDNRKFVRKISLSPNSKTGVVEGFEKIGKTYITIFNRCIAEEKLIEIYETGVTYDRRFSDKEEELEEPVELIDLDQLKPIATHRRSECSWYHV